MKTRQLDKVNCDHHFNSKFLLK